MFLKLFQRLKGPRDKMYFANVQTSLVKQFQLSQCNMGNSYSEIFSQVQRKLKMLACRKSVYYFLKIFFPVSNLHYGFFKDGK
jgi:hypothetical protein